MAGSRSPPLPPPPSLAPPPPPAPLVRQAGTIPTVSVTALETEQGFDFVKLYDGPTAAGAPLVTWSGSMADFETAHTPGTVVGHQQTM